MVDMIFLYLAWKTMHNLHNYLHFSRTLVGGNQSHDLNTLTAGFHEKNIVNGKLFAHETGIQSPLRHHLKYCLTIYKYIYSNNICIRKKKKKVIIRGGRDFHLMDDFSRELVEQKV